MVFLEVPEQNTDRIWIQLSSPFFVQLSFKDAMIWGTGWGDLCLTPIPESHQADTLWCKREHTKFINATLFPHHFCHSWKERSHVSGKVIHTWWYGTGTLYANGNPPLSLEPGYGSQLLEVPKDGLGVGSCTAWAGGPQNVTLKELRKEPGDNACH